ncbi:hypothetical protein ACJJTC_014545 [Scirpophaga incertulas]
MNKENNSAASLRRSAVAERIRLREEWSQLKGVTSSPPLSQSNKTKRTDGSRNQFPKPSKPVGVLKTNSHNNKKSATKNHKAMSAGSDVLSGIVALVDVGVESRALPLRAALTALGATVVPTWSPIVTHLIWAQDGCRATRAKARLMACQLVSPLWVEACASSNSRLPEITFPAVTRPSDLPSPRTLRQLLKKAEMENIPLHNLLSDKDDDIEVKAMRLRISSETENETSKDTSKDVTKDTSKSTSMNTSGDTTLDTSDVESRVNTAPRRALPKSLTPTSKSPAKSKRKLFNQREADNTKSTACDSDADNTTQKRVEIKKPSVNERRELLRAERLARRMVAATRGDKPAPASTAGLVPRIVLTGMCSKERKSITQAIKELNGRVQKRVNRKTTHVVLGACCQYAAPCCGNNVANTSLQSRFNMSGVTQLTGEARAVGPRARTASALAGTARGCVVVCARWVRSCRHQRAWLRPQPAHAVPHLARAAAKARIERSALGQMGAEYAYDVFNSIRVRVSPSASKRDAAIELLKLCGAVVQDGGATQNGGGQDGDCDIIIGESEGEVSSKWVFDSVASARMRTKRRYINHLATSRQDTSR